MSTTEATGLRWHDKRRRPVWHARADAVKAGYRPERVDLAGISDQPELLRLRCAALQADLNLWMAGYRRTNVLDDGSIGSLLEIYTAHPDSPYHQLRPNTIDTYDSHVGYLRAMIGERPIASVTGVDLIRWNRDWSANGKHLAKSQQMRTVLLSACSFGSAMRIPGCAELSGVIRETRRTFKSPKPRTQILTAEQVEAVIAAAHENGAPSRALAYAIIFETTLRLFDVIGQWWPAGRLKSDVIDQNGNAWAGLRWEDVDGDLVLRYVPSKTAGSTGKSIAFPLRSAPMIIEELRHWPAKLRAGPLIVSELSRLPYDPERFQRGWRKDRSAAKLPSDVWARDLRASGITEARASGVLLEDAAKVAGHSSPRTTGNVYDRALLEAAERFATARSASRRSD